MYACTEIASINRSINAYLRMLVCEKEKEGEGKGERKKGKNS